MTPKVYIRPERPEHVIRAKGYAWRDSDGAQSPGVGIFAGSGYGAYKLIQYLTPEQAIQLSNQLVDAVETIQTKEA